MLNDRIVYVASDKVKNFGRKYKTQLLNTAISDSEYRIDNGYTYKLMNSRMYNWGGGISILKYTYFNIL